MFPKGIFVQFKSRGFIVFIYLGYTALLVPSLLVNNYESVPFLFCTEEQYQLAGHLFCFWMKNFQQLGNQLNWIQCHYKILFSTSQNVIFFVQNRMQNTKWLENMYPRSRSDLVWFFNFYLEMLCTPAAVRIRYGDSSGQLLLVERAVVKA